MKYPVASLPPQASEGEKRGWLQESRTGESTEIGLTDRAESFTGGMQQEQQQQRLFKSKLNISDDIRCYRITRQGRR